MKNILKGLVIILTVAFSALIFSSFAIAESQYGTALASVLDVIEITETAPLQFPVCAPGGSGGTLVWDDAVGPADGTIYVVMATGAQGVFTIDGEPGLDVGITVDNECTLDDGAMHEMTATLDCDATATLDGMSGLATVNTRGTLAVAGSQVAGTYEITVIYQ